MNYTPNYHLPTWAMTDRIQMSDFNDMTAKLDTALKAEADAREAETSARQTADAAINTELAKKGAFVKLIEKDITSPSDGVALYFTGIDWNQWQNIYIDLLVGQKSSVILYPNGLAGNAAFTGWNASGDKNSLGTFSSAEGADVFCERIVLHPGRQAKRLVCLTMATGSAVGKITYEQFEYLFFRANFAAGGKIIVWGEA